MNDTRLTRWNPRAASLLLASAMCLVPFLLPRHFPPLRTFYDEWIAFALGAGAIAMAAVARRSESARIPALVLWLSAFALFLAVRAFAGLGAYPQGPLLWALYVLFAGLLVILGHDLVGYFGREQVCDMLASFLLLGAILNSISGVLQVVGIPRPIDAFVSYLHGTRAIGNIGQANLFANYLALGAASLAYLFARARIGLGAGLAAALLLLTGAALAASRSSALYSILFATLGYIAMRDAKGTANRKLGIAAIALAAAGIVMQWLVPVVLNQLGISLEGSFNRFAAPDWESDRDESMNLRLLGWELAWRLFVGAPWLGVGPGEFAGASFAQGLPPALAMRDIWTSPHNLVLQLLAETGLAGAAMVGAGLWVWLRRATPEFCYAPTPAKWWVAACVGVGILHALLEYPFWYAHFLALTALLLGVGASASISLPPLAMRAILASAAIAAGVLLSINLRDYFRFELASPAYAGRSLASDAELQRDLHTLAGLNGGLLAPRAELWLFLSMPLDASRLAEKIAIGSRVMRTWPLREVVIRQCIFLALAGRESDARSLLSQARRTFTNRDRMFREIVDSAPEAARKALGPALREPR